MFHEIPQRVRARMAEMEATDARDRADGTPLAHRLRQVTPQTGRPLALMAAVAPPASRTWWMPSLATR